MNGAQWGCILFRIGRDLEANRLMRSCLDPIYCAHAWIDLEAATTILTPLPSKAWERMSTGRCLLGLVRLGFPQNLGPIKSPFAYRFGIGGRLDKDEQKSSRSPQWRRRRRSGHGDACSAAGEPGRLPPLDPLLAPLVRCTTRMRIFPWQPGLANLHPKKYCFFSNKP
jgi:hypothetical protein